MRSAFSLLRKWFWKWRAVPPWHVQIKISGAVEKVEEYEIKSPSLKLVEGVFEFKLPDFAIIKPEEGTIDIKVPDQITISVHSRGLNE